MTRRIFPLAVLAAAMSLAACADRTPVLPRAPASSATAAGIERLVEMGFARQDIVDAGDHFVVERDMAISKADLAIPGALHSRVAVPGGPRGQWSVSNPVQQSVMQAGITVNLSAISSNSNWLAAARAAMLAWEELSGDNTIKFIETTGTANITVSFGTLSSGLVALGDFPVSSQPGPTVTINSGAANSFSAGQKKWLLVHELGHNIGYRHSNWKTLNEPVGQDGADSIPNTPSSDLSSVMLGNPSTIPSFSAFSLYDKRAAEYLYPATAPTLTSVGYNGSGYPELTWSAVSGAYGYKVRFTSGVEWWVEDSSRYEGGYWSVIHTNGDITTTTGTSYTETTLPYTGDGWCQWQYQVWTIYPSGKMVGFVGTSPMDICWPFPS